MRNLLLFLHIAAVAGWLGGSFLRFVLAARLGTTPGVAASSWWQTSVFVARKYTTYLILVVLLTGVLLVVQDDTYGYEFSNAFVSIGFLAVIVGGALAGAVFGPQSRRAVEQSEAGDASGLAATTQRINLVGVAEVVVVLVTLWGMVAKWGL